MTERTHLIGLGVVGKDLVLLGPDTNELAREKNDRRPSGDPQDGEHRLWNLARGPDQLPR